MDRQALIRRDQVPPNRKLLGRIAQELETKQIRHMAFLANHITRRESLSKITDGWELFVILEAHGLLSSSNFMFLFESLLEIQRPDLVKEVAQELWDVPYAHPVFRVMEHLHREPSQEEHSQLKRCFNSYTEAMRKLTGLADDEKLWEKRFSNTFEVIRARLHSRPAVTATTVQTANVAVSTLETICQHCNQLVHGLFIKFIPTRNPQNIREPIEQWQQFYSKLEEVWDSLEWEKEARSKEHIKRKEGESHPIGKAMTEAYKCLIELAQGMLCEMAVEEESEKLSEILCLIERMIYLAVNQLLYFVIPWLSSIIYLAAQPRAEMAPFRRRLQDMYDKNEAEVLRMKAENQAQSVSTPAVNLVATLWQMTLNPLIENSETGSVTSDCQTLFAKGLESEKKTFYNIYILAAKKCADTARTSLDQFKEERIDDLVKNIENETGREILRNAIRNSLRYDRLK